MSERYAHVIRRIVILMLVLFVAVLPTAQAASFSFMPTREYEGQIYEARSESAITSLLLIGFDHHNDGDVTVEQHGYAYGGQSDFLLLVVLDHEAKQIRRLQIDRDTITDIKLINSRGKSLGTRKLQICLSHAYGGTQEVNNANAVWAVENMLTIANQYDGAGIDGYITMDISGISKLNDLLGGVTVYISDDFSEVDETMVIGTTMKLTGRQAEYFCRGRYKVADKTNVNRMSRQRTYMNAAGTLLMEKLRKDINYATQLLNEMGVIYDRSSTLDAGFGFTLEDNAGTPAGEKTSSYLMTNRTLDDLVGMMASALEYELTEIETLPGEHSKGADGYIRYDLEPGAAERWMMSVFYKPLGF